MHIGLLNVHAVSEDVAWGFVAALSDRDCSEGEQRRLHDHYGITTHSPTTRIRGNLIRSLV